ncbi:MAG: cyclic nucleotide-binding/CBS domain-containing protein [Thermodesulforhabdaceae bacterium]|jgi:CBS domain-containing protein
MKVWEFMTRKIEWIDADSSVYDAIERMVNKRIRSLAVYYPESKDQRGVITARDVVFRVLGEGKDPRKTKIREIACSPMICISKDEDMQAVLEIMKESNIARVFVCDGDDIVGVVALMDVMYASLIERAKANHNNV